jgi:transposase InsO family protein
MANAISPASGQRYGLRRVCQIFCQIWGMPRSSVCAARRRALRHDHASTFMADRFQKQIRFLGISPSYTLVGERETNGVIERPFRTLKEQVIHGRIFQTIDQPRDAVRAFAARCNAERLIGKNRFHSPLDARAAWLEPKATPEGRYTSLRRAA